MAHHHATDRRADAPAQPARRKPQGPARDHRLLRAADASARLAANRATNHLLGIRHPARRPAPPLGVLSLRRSFDTYVVADVPNTPHLFAFIDNGKPRTAANALQTAGLDGVSPLIRKVLDMTYNYEHGLYTATKVKTHGRNSPIWYVRMSENNPHAPTGARLASSDYSDASKLLGKDVVAFATKTILDLYRDEMIPEAFFNAFMGIEQTNADDPVNQLRELIVRDAQKLDPMRTHIKLANLILAFNAWIQEQPLKKRWALQAHEDFPAFVELNLTKDEEAA